MLTIENYSGLSGSTFIVNEKEWYILYITEDADDSFWDCPTYSINTFPREEPKDKELTWEAGMIITIDRKLEEGKSKYLVCSIEDGSYSYLGIKDLQNKDKFIKFIQNMITKVQNRQNKKLLKLK
jgi:hypothetical protein